MKSLPGHHLSNRYQLLAEVGRGGMGVVYQAQDAMLRRTVAVKVLTPQLMADPSFVQRFRHEAVAAASLRHPNIATVYDVGEDTLRGERIHYLVMEFIEGETLDRVLQRGGRPFTLSQADAIVRQVADALGYAHQRGMIHRDVKPANIMLGVDGHVTLMDFGLVRAGEASQLTQTGTVLGTPAYMAPEQIMDAQVDRRADIYALGVVIYELLTGDVPFRRTTPLATVHAQVYDAPPPLRERQPELPPSVESVVLHALVKNPGGRYQDVSHLAADFSHAVTGQMPEGLAEKRGQQAVPLPDATIQAPALSRPSPARPAPPPDPPPAQPARARRVSPWLWIAIGLLLALIGAGALVASGGLRPSGPAVSATATSPPPQTQPVAVAEAETPTATPATAPEGPAVLPANTSTSTATNAAAPTSTPIPPSPTPTALLTAQAQVIGDVLNVRSGPGTEYAVAGQIRRDETYQVVGRNANSSWWQICCLAGEAGWVASNLVRVTGPADAVVVVGAALPTTTPSLDPPPSTASGYHALSLASVANGNIADGYVDPPLGRVILAGVPFDLGRGETFTSQAGSLASYPTSARLAANVTGPQAVYLLLTGGNTFSRFAGRTVGQVRLAFDDGSVLPVDLTVGVNLREWKHFGQDTVTTKSSADLVEVWRGANRYDAGTAIIDMLTIGVPPAWQGRRLTGIEIVDRSVDTVGDPDPAINWLGATVRMGEAAMPAPTNTPTAPGPTSCALPAGPTFARVWQRDLMGCPTSNENGVTSAYETFERGFMVWRKDIDSHFVVFDDGAWSRFSFPPAEPVDLACPEAAQLGRPRRGFSQVWCGYPEVRQRIGNALDDEIGNDRPLQVFQQGFMIFIPERNAIYALLDNGLWRRSD